MKNLILVGQFNRNVGLKYQSLLQEEGIDVVIEDWSNSLEVTAGYSLIRLLVPVQDYQRSLKLIDDFEDSASKRLNESGEKAVGKELFKTISGIILSALITIGIIFSLFYIYRIYNINLSRKLFKEAVAESKRGDFSQAIVDYTKVLKISPYSASAYYDRGLAYYKSGNLSYAVADFYKAIEFNPDYSKAYSARGLALYKLGNSHQAMADLSKAIEMNPNDVNVYIKRGWIYDKQGNYALAIADNKKAIEINPNDAIAYNNLGYTYAEQGDLQQAFKCLDKAIEIDPKSRYAYTSRAFAYYKEKEYEKAWEDVHKEESFGYKLEKEDLDFLAKLKKASGRDK